MTTRAEDVRRWVAAGLIDEATGARILAFEMQAGVERDGGSDRPGVLELLIYLAAAIIGAGIAVLVATNWGHLASAARIAIPTGCAVGVFIAGQWLRRGSAAMIRAASLSWLLAGALAVTSVAVAANEWGASENNVALTAGMSALVVSVALWVPMRMHLQIVGIGGAELLFALALTAQSGEEWGLVILGLVLASFGLAGLLASESGILVPRVSARLLAGAGLAAGAFWAGMPPSAPVAELLAAVVAVLLLTAGIRYQSLIYVAFGVLAAFTGMLKLVLRHVEDPTLAALSLIVIGLLLLLSIAGLRRSPVWQSATSRSTERELPQ